MKTETCPQCQAENPTGALVCVDCGTSLVSHDALDENQSLPEDQAADETEQLLDWLKDLEPAGERLDQDSEKSADSSESKTEPDSLADWLSDVTPHEEEWEDVEDSKSMTDWFDGLEDIYEERDIDPSELAQTAPLTDYHEVEGIPEQLAATNLPEWLKQEQPEGEGSFEAYETIGETPDPTPEDKDRPIEAFQSSSDEDIPSELSPASSEDKLPPDEPPEIKEDLPGETPEEPVDWYAELALTDVESALDELLDDQSESAEDLSSDDWIDLDEEIADLEEEGVEKPSLLDETTDLSDSEIPDWLESLKPEELVDPAAVDQPAETSGPLVGLKGVIPLVAGVTDPVETGSVAEFKMSKGQQQQVALLKQLTRAEPAAVPSETRRTIGDNFLAFRLVIGSLLFIVVVAGWILPSVNEMLPGWVMPPTPIHTEAALAELALASSEPVLVAFEYTPAMAGELDPVALAVLQNLAANERTIFTISQVPAGVQVASQVVEQVEELDGQALGYLPGDAIGLRNLASCINNVGTCAHVNGLSMEEETQALLGQISLIVVLSGERDAIVNWIEQVGAQVDVPMIGGITQAMNPIAAPYVASSQMLGAVGGLPAVAAIDDGASADDNFVEQAMNSVTLAQWLAVIVLLIGALFYGLSGFVPTGTNKQA